MTTIDKVERESEDEFRVWLNLDGFHFSCNFVVIREGGIEALNFQDCSSMDFDRISNSSSSNRLVHELLKIVSNPLATFPVIVSES